MKWVKRANFLLFYSLWLSFLQSLECYIKLVSFPLFFLLNTFSVSTKNKMFMWSKGLEILLCGICCDLGEWCGSIVWRGDAYGLSCKRVLLLPGTLSHQVKIYGSMSALAELLGWSRDPIWFKKRSSCWGIDSWLVYFIFFLLSCVCLCFVFFLLWHWLVCGLWLWPHDLLVMLTCCFDVVGSVTPSICDQGFKF